MGVASRAAAGSYPTRRRSLGVGNRPGEEAGEVRQRGGHRRGMGEPAVAWDRGGDWGVGCGGSALLRVRRGRPERPSWALPRSLPYEGRALTFG